MNNLPPSLERYLINPSDYSRVEKIGAGGFAFVELVENKTTGKKCCIYSLAYR